jgi:hypothetical protein
MTTSTPDLAIATDDIQSLSTRDVCQQLGGSGHKPVIICIDKEHGTQQTRMTPSWNYKKANWELFEHLTDENCQTIPENLSVDRKVKMRNKAILSAAKESISRRAINWSLNSKK